MKPACSFQAFSQIFFFWPSAKLSRSSSLFIHSVFLGCELGMFCSFDLVSLTFFSWPAMMLEEVAQRRIREIKTRGTKSPRRNQKCSLMNVSLSSFIAVSF